MTDRHFCGIIRMEAALENVFSAADLMGKGGSAMPMAIHGLLMTRAHYSQVGDVTVMALCLVMFVLISQSFVSKDKRFRSMAAMLAR